MLDKIRGCLVGGAVGDALGYPVEFLQDFTIFKRYGEAGITEYTLTDGTAIVSDDTQMTLFTAEGLLRARKKFVKPTVDDYIEEIYKSYLDWLKTQSTDFDPTAAHPRSELLGIAALFKPRAPGTTCLSALSSGRCGTLDYRINNSKGCGGVMRVAPIPLMLAGSSYLTPDDVDMIAARASAITHGHELGYVSSAFLSRIIVELLGGADIRAAVDSARRNMKKNFGESDLVTYFDTKIAKALHLASDTDVDTLDAIRELGEGWVAEETVAIAVYCSLRFSRDFENAVIAAVNHSGDSDSTGAVTGNILGAYLGYSAIPEKFITKLEFKDILLDFADRLAR